ncbi:hypothetical protein [Pseudostreptobacillus hongkongensis]|uniref:hypothetical protein n=1 Tax=Pseudostreptobacillus hongkongensis TaxID=1162717 RepID=UPI000B3141FA|nr:hypothetical protein [Pseudostreptobacillus hongkongensis]
MKKKKRVIIKEVTEIKKTHSVTNKFIVALIITLFIELVKLIEIIIKAKYGA